MQAPHQLPQTPSPPALPNLWQWVVRGLGIAAFVVAMTQNLDVEYSAKDLHTKFRYRGNVLIDPVRIKDGR